MQSKSKQIFEFNDERNISSTLTLLSHSQNETQPKVKRLLMTPQKQLFQGNLNFLCLSMSFFFFFFNFLYNLNLSQPLWLAVVVVHDCERLLIAGLVNILAHA